MTSPRVTPPRGAGVPSLTRRNVAGDSLHFANRKQIVNELDKVSRASSETLNDAGPGSTGKSRWTNSDAPWNASRPMPNSQGGNVQFASDSHTSPQTPLSHSGPMDLVSERSYSVRAMAPSSTAPDVSIPPGRLVASLFAVYVIWGSTYLAMRFAIESYPPFLMAGIRFTLAGGLLFAYARFGRGEAVPTRSQWWASVRVGVLLLFGGNGMVAFAQQWVASSVAAVVIASVALWASLFAGLWGRWPRPRDWMGLTLGLVGVLILNLRGDLRASPLGAALLLFAAASWAFGSVWSRHLDMPKGFMSSAAQMLSGGVALFALSLARGDRIHEVPTLRATAAVLYLVVFGSLIAYSAYQYLLKSVRPELATSYVYVNPLVAVLLGVGLAGESLTAHGLLGMVVILAGVVLVVMGGAQSRRRTPADGSVGAGMTAKAP